MGRLRVTNGPLAGKTINVTEKIVVGREDVDLVLDDEQVSRRHVAVRPLPGALEVEDLGSSNGTYVDGRSIDSPTRVGEGAEIRLGETVLSVEGVLPLGELPDARLTKVSDRPSVELQAAGARDVRAGADRAQEPSAAAGRPERPAHAVHAEEGAAPRAAVALASGHDAGQAAIPAAFQTAARTRRQGLASRSWVPVALSFSTVILVCAALVIYFAGR